jgi:hypothetical protein
MKPTIIERDSPETGRAATGAGTTVRGFRDKSVPCRTESPNRPRVRNPGQVSLLQRWRDLLAVKRSRPDPLACRRSTRWQWLTSMIE